MSDGADETAVPLPSLRDLCISAPLYVAHSVDTKNETDAKYLNSLRYSAFQFDAHCIHCGKESTFKRSISVKDTPVKKLSDFSSPDPFFEMGRIIVTLHCARVGHAIEFYFQFSNKSLTKVGQAPSLADIAGADIEKYRGVLGKEYFAELKRATGLASHGVGIGAFVYLRRIFERLIDQARLRSKADPTTMSDEEFGALRMDGKILSLKDQLPSALVKNRAVYSILSKGIHELSEADCKAHFKVIRAALIQILEQDFQAAEARRVEVETEQEVASINAILKVAAKKTN